MTLPPSPWDCALSRSYDSIFSVTATVQFPISIPDFASSSFLVHQTLVYCHLLAHEQDIDNWLHPGAAFLCFAGHQHVDTCSRLQYYFPDEAADVSSLQEAYVRGRPVCAIAWCSLVQQTGVIIEEDPHPHLRSIGRPV